MYVLMYMYICICISNRHMYFIFTCIYVYVYVSVYLWMVMDGNAWQRMVMYGMVTYGILCMHICMYKDENTPNMVVFKAKKGNAQMSGNTWESQPPKWARRATIRLQKW